MHLVIFQQNEYKVNDNPNEQDVIKSIQQLDGLKHHTINLYTISRRLLIYCSESRRMFVAFSHERGLSFLRDKKQTGDLQVSFRVSNSEVDDYPISRTVNESQVIEAALVFLKQTPFSLPENLEWDDGL